EEERWKFQAEILRAECNLLRIERQFALKKLEKNRVNMEKTLKSAVQTLLNGRKQIFEGKNVEAVLEEEIEDLEEKLEQLQTTNNGGNSVQGVAAAHNNNKYINFDRGASILQRRLQKLEGFCKTETKSIDNVQEKMSELSNGLLETFEEEEEEYNSIVSGVTSTSAFSGNACNGRCRALVQRIMAQVRSETEEWAQMQGMVRKVRAEMEQLQISRDYWESRARESNQQVQFLRLVVNQWRDKALCHEDEVKRLEAVV
ncbi:hypothetical protein M569_17171, partial [Genlisea aurea]